MIDWSKSFGEIQQEEGTCFQCGSRLRWNRMDEHWEECECCYYAPREKPQPQPKYINADQDEDVPF